ncbi:hypothetical protein POM88_003018 [Heracleum sosnowskyi]|uniref:Replication protein A 70 kDa DNA-binding subunit B/D first OB fold domain-containing protein n=1 Tax=Heracleum sosnowskyi TaxID=360622 RepID=A0AAD8ND34_9APIA|nr:hypothetical protein POM88_003018 [Heracleum sosnowskyi]
MASTKLDSFRDLRKGKYDWKVTARIMNLWRGYTKSGEPFQGFNLLLLDNKRCRIHAFVPGNVAPQIEPKLQVGELYLFKNFTVKEYRPDDKFRCIHKDIQIVFSNDTRISDLEESDVFIEQCVFDFYDLADLKQLSQQTTYLTDVVGIIKKPEPVLSKLINKFGQDQTTTRFQITDGRTTVKVTFWDAFAEQLAEALKEDFERPVIIIIGSCRVIEWKEKIDISNVGATTFYLNYNHHSVTQMRKMLKDPVFGKEYLSSNTHIPLKRCTVAEIKNLGEDDIQCQVICLLKIDQVPEMDTWFHHVCTSCYNESKIVGTDCYCNICKRIVPHPDKWFELWVLASDETGQLDIMLENVPARKCLGKSVREIGEMIPKVQFPQILKSIENKEYTIKLLIRE